MPVGEAQAPTGWTTPTALGLTTSAQRFSNIASNGENLAVVVMPTTGNLALWKYDATSHVWSSAAITTPCNGITDPNDIRLIYPAANEFTFLLKKQAANRATICNTVDGGVTWTNPVAGSGNVGSASVQNLINIGLNAFAIYTSSPDVLFIKSTNGGTTWSSPVGEAVNDNAAGPGDTATTRISPDSAGMYASDSTHLTIVMTVGAAFYSVSSTDGGIFWTTPYTANLGSTLNPIYTDSQTVDYVQISPSPIPLYSFLRTTGTGTANFNPTTTRDFSSFQTDGTCVSRVDTAAVPTQQPIFTGNNANTYIGLSACGNPVGFTVSYKLSAGSWTTATTSIPSTVRPTAYTVGMTPTKTWVIYTNDPSSGQVLATSADTPSAITNLGAANTVAVTGLVGFDVDPSGALAVARTNGGNGIRTYGASTLTENNNVGTSCNLTRGVMAGDSDHVAYFHCSSGTTIDGLYIASSTLGNPTQPPKCLDFPSGVCPFHITNGDMIHPNGESQIELSGITDFPIDFSRSVDDTCAGGCTVQSVAMAFAFSTTAGDIGVSIINQFSSGGDVTSIALANMGESTQPPEQLCVTRDLDGKDYIYAVSTLTNTKAWRVDFHKETFGFGRQKYAPTLTQVFPGTAGTAGANGVACGRNHFAVMKSTSLTIWNCRAGCTNAAVTITGLVGTPTGGIAMSDDGETLAFIDAVGSTDCTDAAGCWHLINTTNGHYLINGTKPSGTFQVMKEHGAGSSLWIATSTEIDRYATFPFVGNGTDQSYTPPCHGASETCDDNSNSNSGSGTSTGAAGGGGGFGGGSCTGAEGGILEISDCTSAYMITFVFMGIATILCLVVSVMAGGHSLLAYGSMNLIAYFMGIILCGVSPWPIAILVILAVGLGIARFKSGA